MITDPSPAKLRFDGFELDETEARLTRAGEPVALAPKPFAVLCVLARTPGKLFAKNALLDLVWGHRFITEASLKTAISELRAALDDDPKQPRYIETVSRRGYRFIAAPISSTLLGVTTAQRNGTNDPDRPAIAALTALCRGDAALADLILGVAAMLERERLALDDAWHAQPPMHISEQHLEGSASPACHPRRSIRGSRNGGRHPAHRATQVHHSGLEECIP
jgi:DNA-binding winged helix-turn-helix (wHTH) protein